MNHRINLAELAKRESATVEWKENVADVRDVIETIVAFANDFLNLGGGYIVCGAKERKDEYGFQTVDYIGLTAQRLKEVKERVINDCTNATRVNPPINPLIDEIEIPDDNTRRILIFTIDATNYAHSYKSDRDDIPRYFIKTDYNTKEATNGFIRELLRRKGQIEPWDKRINTSSSITDIDQLVLRQYLQNMKLWVQNKPIDEFLSDKEKIEEFIPPLLGRTGIDKPLCPKNFTLMVFGKAPIDFCNGAYSMFTIFEGKDRSKPSGESQWITGTIVEQANKLIELLNIESTIAIDKNNDIPNQFKYPKIALKEAVVNALVHRDYETDQPVRIEVYNDRVEIYSPGGLPFNVEKEKFINGNAKASWRNQAFGRIFTRLNLAQHQGSGIGRILDSMKEEGCPSPIFEITNDSVTCILPAHPRHQLMKKLSEAESEIVIKDYQSAYHKLQTILENDSYNYRAIELFCDVNNLLNSPKNVYDFLNNSQIDISQIRASTLIILSETLSLIRDNEGAKELSKNLLSKAITGRLEEKQLIKVAYTLKKLGDDKKVITFVSDTIRQYPTLQHNPFLLQQKARAEIDLAKICRETYNDRKINFKIKTKAKEEFQNYLLQAEKDLNNAYENSESQIDREWILRDLNYIKEEMRTGKNDNIYRKTIHVTKLPDSTTEKVIKEVFKRFGNIEKITLPKDESGKIKGYAFILYSNIEEAEFAFQNRFNLFIDNEKIFVNKYRKKNNNTQNKQ